MTASPLTRNNFKVVSVLIKFSDPESQLPRPEDPLSDLNKNARMSASLKQ